MEFLISRSKSIVYTSGTLSPISYFSTKLGINQYTSIIK